MGQGGFGHFAGFLIAWNLWVYAVVCVGAIVFTVPTDIAYMIGPAAAWIPASEAATMAITGDGRRGHHAGGDSRVGHG